MQESALPSENPVVPLSRTDEPPSLQYCVTDVFISSPPECQAEVEVGEKAEGQNELLFSGAALPRYAGKAVDENFVTSYEIEA
jgi:hypothetical protein